MLGVAAGTEDTLFYLTRRVKQVFATDRYYEPGAWGPVAPGLMLVEPGDIAPFEFDLERLVVQHMDGRSLRYPADTFDGIFSSGSIEHFGELEDAAYAAYEMGRVLKPGGILSISTEFRLSGPLDGIGWPGRTLLFSPETIRRYIVEASGLTPVDELRPVVSEATLATPRDLDAVIADRTKKRPPDAGPEFVHWDFPHLVLVKDDYVFTSVHLALRKMDMYPDVGNAWAKPPRSVLASITEYNRSVAASPEPSVVGEPGAAEEPAAPAALGEVADAVPAAAEQPVQANPAPAAVEQPARSDAPADERLAALVRSQDFPADKAAAIDRVDALLAAVDRDRDEADSRLAEVAGTGGRIERRLAELDVDPEPDAAPASLAATVRLPDGQAQRLKVRSMVGLLPLCAVSVFEGEFRKKYPDAVERFKVFFDERPALRKFIHDPAAVGINDRRLGALTGAGSGALRGLEPPSDGWETESDQMRLPAAASARAPSLPGSGARADQTYFRSCVISEKRSAPCAGGRR